MRRFIFVCLWSAVLAAPQGYQYNQQQQNVPNFSINHQVSQAAQTQENHSFLQQAANTNNFQQTLFNVQSPLQNTQQQQQFYTGPSFLQYKQPVHQQLQQQQPPLINNFGEQLQQQQQQQYNSFQQQYQTPSTVTKDIYVHVAPEDIPDQRYQRPILPPPPPPRKHYRIVFIKAPTQTHSNAALRVQQAPTEEKTIIYVLTKKTDPLDLQTVFQESQPKQLSKPEVYFIKYKTKEEAQHAQRTIQAQYDQLGGTSQVSDEGVAPVTSVIGSLDGSQSQFGLDYTKGSGHVSSSSSSSSSSASASSTSSSSSSSSLSSNRNVISSSKYLPPIVKL